MIDVPAPRHISPAHSFGKARVFASLFTHIDERRTSRASASESVGGNVQASSSQ